MAEAALFVGQGAVDQLFELLDLEGLELENLGAGDEGAVDVEEGVVGRGADQAQVSALDVGQEDVLLRFVEVVDLVDEQDRFPSGGSKTVRSGGDHFPHFGDGCSRRASPFEFRLGQISDE